MSLIVSLQTCVHMLNPPTTTNPHPPTVVYGPCDFTFECACDSLNHLSVKRYEKGHRDPDKMIRHSRWNQFKAPIFSFHMQIEISKGSSLFCIASKNITTSVQTESSWTLSTLPAAAAEADKRSENAGSFFRQLGPISCFLSLKHETRWGYGWRFSISHFSNRSNSARSGIRATTQGG